MFQAKELFLIQYAGEDAGVSVSAQILASDQQVSEAMAEATETQHTCESWILWIIVVNLIVVMGFIVLAGCATNKERVSNKTAVMYALMICTLGVVYFFIHLVDNVWWYNGWYYDGFYSTFKYWFLWLARASALLYFWFFNVRFM